MRLNQDLVNLVKTLEGRANEADKKAINDVLQNVGLNDCITRLRDTT